MKVGNGRVPPLVALSATAAAYAVALGLLYWVSVRSLLGREFEDAALRGAVLTEGADTADLVLDIVSAGSLMGALAVVALIALVRLARVVGLAAIAVLAAANVTTAALKEVLLSRPDLGLDEYAPVTLNSLPSGHTTAVFSALAAVLIVLPQRLRLPVAAAGGLVTFLTALATMSAGWHRAADGIAAFLVVGGWTTVAIAIVVAVSDAPRTTPRRSSVAARWFGAVTAGALLVGVVGLFVLDAASGFRETTLGQAVAFLAATCLVLGALAGVLLATLRSLESMESMVGANPGMPGTRVRD